MAKSNLLYTQANAGIYTRVKKLDMTGGSTVSFDTTGSNAGAVGISWVGNDTARGKMKLDFYYGGSIVADNMLEDVIYELAPAKVYSTAGSAGVAYIYYFGGHKSSGDL